VVEAGKGGEENGVARVPCALEVCQMSKQKRHVGDYQKDCYERKQQRNHGVGAGAI